MICRPDFEKIKSYREFSTYYWYREELKDICKKLGIDFSGSKLDLNRNIEEYFKGNIIKKTNNKKTKIVNNTTPLSLETKLIECGFCFNQKFRDFFSKSSGIANFKFTADMVATSKQVKEDQDASFTLKDLLDIYYGKKEYARFDNSACQWNNFVKDFCADKSNDMFTNKLKVASILWKELRNSTTEKIYAKDLIEVHFHKIRGYIIK